MFQADRIIALDIGASKIVVAEFLCPKAQAPQLLSYGIGKLGVVPERETDLSAYVVSALREQLRQGNIKPGPLYMCVSGQTVFPRFVKLPPVSADKVLQMIRYEAEQNVPFPIEEVVWDYQILPGAAPGELNVMLVAVKLESVAGVTDWVQAAKLEPEVVDAGPMALYNAVRYNYPELSGCTLVLDIGARSCDLIFIEESRVFSRSVPVAGNAMTSEIAKELGVSFEEAEELKRAHGMVSLGGVHAGPEDETADRIARIIRNVATRLHAEVSRSVNFYRSQQGGGLPERVLLTGGSSVLPHLDRFFEEKLKVPVEAFNPFINVSVAPGVPEDHVAADVPLLGGVVGLALRRALSCPIEINLMPPALVTAKRFRRRVPFFVLSAVGLLAIMLCVWGYSHQMRAIRRTQLGEVNARIASLQKIQENLDRTVQRKQEAAARVQSITDLITWKSQWAEVFDALHLCLLEGMWLTSVKPVATGENLITALEISGRGFQDKLQPFNTPEATALEVFRDKLRESPCFTEETEITRIPAMAAGAYAHDFSILAHLRRPMRL